MKHDDNISGNMSGEHVEKIAHYFKFFMNIWIFRGRKNCYALSRASLPFPISLSYMYIYVNKKINSSFQRMYYTNFMWKLNILQNYTPSNEMEGG